MGFFDSVFFFLLPILNLLVCQVLWWPLSRSRWPKRVWVCGIGGKVNWSLVGALLKDAAGGDLMELWLEGVSKMWMLPGRWVLVLFWRNWRALYEWLRLGMLQKHFDKGVQGMKWCGSCGGGDNHCMWLFSACQPDRREVKQVWRLERRRQIQSKRQIKDLGAEKWKRGGFCDVRPFFSYP